MVFVSRIKTNKEKSGDKQDYPSDELSGMLQSSSLTMANVESNYHYWQFDNCTHSSAKAIFNRCTHSSSQLSQAIEYLESISIKSKLFVVPIFGFQPHPRLSLK